MMENLTLVVKLYATKMCDHGVSRIMLFVAAGSHSVIIVPL